MPDIAHFALVLLCGTLFTPRLVIVHASGGGECGAEVPVLRAIAPIYHYQEFVNPMEGEMVSGFIVIRIRETRASRVCLLPK